VGINPTPPPTAASILSKTPNAAASKGATTGGSNAVWPPQKLPAVPLTAGGEPPAAKNATPAASVPALSLKGSAPAAASGAPAPPTASTLSASPSPLAPQAARSRKPAAAPRAGSRIPASKSTTVPTDTGMANATAPAAVPATSASDASETAAAEHDGAGTQAAAARSSIDPTLPTAVTAPATPIAGPLAGGTPAATQDLTSSASPDEEAATAALTDTAPANHVATPPFAGVAAATAQVSGSRNTADTSANPASAQSSSLPLGSASVAHTADATPVTETLQTHTPVGSSGWADEVGTHVVWMAHQGVTSASLRLQPEELGPLEVKISVHESAVSVWFGAREPTTRSALEQALPQLKEMLSAQGFNLTDAGVSREPPRGALYSARSAPTTASAPPAQDANDIATTPVSRGLIDTYA
jgi:flagellar hook-length control protein FliK